MNPTHRNYFLYALVLAFQGGIYNLTGLINTLPFQAQRDFHPSLPIDFLIPFVPETIWLYGLYYLILLSGFLLAKDSARFPHFLKNFVLLSLFADLMFVLLPVSMPLQSLNADSESLTIKLFHLILAVDTRSNCFPSLHCAHSFLITYYFYQSDRFPSLLKLLLLVMTVSVVIATLTVKQHWFLDILGAFVLFILFQRVYEKKLQNQRV